MLKTDIGRDRLRDLHGAAIDDKAFQRFSAYLSQAETFYLSAETMPPESRPLVAYYFFLNLTKAFLTCVDPDLTAQRANHGLQDAFEKKSRYWFQHEAVKVGRPTGTTTNVFAELAARTGAGYCHPPGKELSIQKLAPYLVEAADILEDAVGTAPKLVPIESLRVLGRGGEAWLRLEIEGGELRRRAVSSQQLAPRAAHFNTVFEAVAPDDRYHEVYESRDQWSYRTGRGGVNYARCAEDVIEAFERSLIHSNRGTTGARHLIVLSKRIGLLSQEAVAFLVMHHLSNMVRYRPEQVVKLGDNRWFFLFTTWVPRATENFLLALMSRMLREEVRIG